MIPLAEALTEAELIKILLEKPVALWGFILARFGPISIGLILAILAFVKRGDRKRMGLPRLPEAVVTQPFALVQALMLLAAGFFLLPGVMQIILAGVLGADPQDAPLWVSIAAMAAGTIPVAVIIVLRRQRLQLQSADRTAQFVDQVFGDDEDPDEGDLPAEPTRPPAPGAAFLLGARTVCIALLISTPLAIAWTFLIKAVTGETPALQGLIQTALDPASTYEPWLIAGYGVILAPFTEEAIFRGMIYPALLPVAIRGMGMTPRKAMWVCMIFVSLLFALVHWNVLAIVPLFALALVLNWVLQRTNSLAACVIAHALHNALSMIPVLLLRLA